VYTICIGIFVFSSRVGPFTAALKRGNVLQCRRAGGVGGGKG